MPRDFWSDAASLAAAFALLLPVMLAVAAVGRLLARRGGLPLWPRWRHTTPGWRGVDAGLFYVAHMVAVSLGVAALASMASQPALPGSNSADIASQSVGGGQTRANTLRALAANLVAVPVLLAVAFALRRWVYAVPLRLTRGRAGQAVSWGALAALLATPLTLVAHAATLAAAGWLGVPADDHPLTRLGLGADAPELLLLGVAVCVVTPLWEEFLFRSVLLRDAMASPLRGGVLIVVAAGFASVPSWSGKSAAGPLALVAFGGLLFALAVRRGSRRRRTASAIVATATLFAALHTSVWPTPVPLFLLGLALGYVAARSGGFLASAVAHGLFNAVSFVVLVRG